jgi:hypothetical protein
MRTRRSARGITFSFDSFLDVVANVIGIILRLILVAWVGARSYQAIVTLQADRQALARLEGELQDRKDRLQRSEGLVARASQSLAAVRAERAQFEERLAAFPPIDPSSRAALVARKEAAKARRDELAERLRALPRAAPAAKVLRYRTPVSRALQSEEMMFELRRGRVTPIDLAVLLQDVRRGMDEARDRLKTQWEVTGVTAPAGAFRMRYVVVRQRGLLDALGAAGPASDTSYRYGLDSWVLEPVEERRGETADEALAPNSAFRKLVDRIQPDLTAVTFWVYPDSFPEYRRLRDYLYGRGIEVAGRPLPSQASISASRRGTASRGQ